MELNQNSVLLPIKKQEHLNFLVQLFNGSGDKPVKITRLNFCGKFIFSLRKVSLKPIPQVIPENYKTVELVFPETSHCKSGNNFFYFPLEAVEQINDFVSATFDLYFHTYFFETFDLDKLSQTPNFEHVEITKELLIDSFVFGLDLVDTSKANETFKKRLYRKQLKEIARLRKRFIMKDYNFRKSIFIQRRKNLNFLLFNMHK
jgi:glycosyltransferase involved in cell wall biosynthesis